MIYLHHNKLANISTHQQNSTQKSQLKSDIYQYRHRILSDFCLQNDLAVPQYDKTVHGKPIVTHGGFVFNQSHTNDDYLLAYSTDVVEIGVDVECVHRPVQAQKLAERFFHANEYTLWQDCDCNRLLWFKIWTIKEAVLKANGLGIRMCLNELNAKFINDYQGELFHEKIGHYRFECVVMNDDVITIAYVSDDWQAWTWF